MSRAAVCDASAVVAMLLDGGPDGRWATEALRGHELAASSVFPFEVANVLRRRELAGLTGADQTAQAHADLNDLRVQLWPHAPLAARIWELRANLSVYDASYVAVAERLDAPLITLDRRLARAPGLRCPVHTP